MLNVKIKLYQTSSFWHKSQLYCLWNFFQPFGQSMIVPIKYSFLRQFINKKWKHFNDKNAFQWDAYRPLVDSMCVCMGGVCLGGGSLSRGCVYPGGVSTQGVSAWGAHMTYPMMHLILPVCCLHTATPTETQQQCSCLYTAGWSCDLQGMLGYTPPPRGQTDTCKNIIFANYVCGR